ncbi:hypothetical protein [Alteromonas ponticola]|uniref:Uncharacterized protein n=1 Tax=Alteromonas ponticola TaxID=2720613 RepID=A0ABX1R715_9ALTE|nr:hypothetical protein [Alteromonas ponticola]NMH61272.1 hypothetical protein [Alteromonas ponticola]
MSLRKTHSKLQEVIETEKFLKLHQYSSAAYILSKIFLSLNETWRNEDLNINMIDLLQLDNNNYNNLIAIIDYVWLHNSVRTSSLFEAESMRLMREIVKQ